MSGGLSTILPGLKIPSRIERAFDGAEGFVEQWPEHLPHERAAHQAVAMLAGKRAAELQHEIGDVLRDGFELRECPRLFSCSPPGRTCRQPTEACA